MRGRGRWAPVLAPLLLVLVGLIAWQAYSARLGSAAVLLPAPTRVVSAAWESRSELATNALPTLGAALLGFALALAVGFALSVVIDTWRSARLAALPLLVVSQTIPLVVMAPLLVLWFGFGLLPKVLLVALVTIFPITVALVRGYEEGGAIGHDVMESLGATRRQEYVRLRLPASLPSLFTGIRIAITYAVIAAVFAEYAGATRGLGILMQVAKNSFRTDLVLAAVAVTAGLTLALYALTLVVERLCVPWARTTGH